MDGRAGPPRWSDRARAPAHRRLAERSRSLLARGREYVLRRGPRHLPREQQRRDPARDPRPARAGPDRRAAPALRRGVPRRVRARRGLLPHRRRRRLQRVGRAPGPPRREPGCPPRDGHVGRRGTGPARPPRPRKFGLERPRPLGGVPRAPGAALARPPRGVRAVRRLPARLPPRSRADRRLVGGQPPAARSAPGSSTATSTRGTCCTTAAVRASSRSWTGRCARSATRCSTSGCSWPRPRRTASRRARSSVASGEPAACPRPPSSSRPTPSTAIAISPRPIGTWSSRASRPRSSPTAPTAGPGGQGAACDGRPPAHDLARVAGTRHRAGRLRQPPRHLPAIF